MTTLNIAQQLGNLDHLFHTPRNICEWAEEKITVRVSDRAGRLILDPYQRAILEACADPSVLQVTLMMSSQIGKTLIEAIVAGWVIDENPQPMMFMHATQQGLDKFIREKLEPILIGTPSINEKILRNNRGNIKGDGFQFANGYCTMTTARSMSSRHGTSASLVIADEVDDYGNATLVSSLRQRTISFGEGKLIVSSTPTISGSSQIETEYAEGSQSMWWAKCVHCDGDQLLLWENIVDYNLVCPICGSVWSENDRLQSIARGHYEEVNPNPTHKSFWLSQLYSYNTTLQKTVEEGSRYSRQELNTQVLAWPYEEVELPPAEAEMIFREECLFEPTFVAVGVDVQKTHLEYGVWYFDADYDYKHLVAYDVVLRSTPEVTFANLRRALSPYKPMRITIDGSYDFDWVNVGMQRIFPDALIMKNPPIEIVRGYAGDSFDKPLRGAKGHGYTWVSTDEAKVMINQDIYNGRISFNPDIALNAEEQMVAEKLIRMTVNTKLKRSWRKVHEGVKNELLDITVYAYCGVLGIDDSIFPAPDIEVR